MFILVYSDRRCSEVVIITFIGGFVSLYYLLFGCCSGIMIIANAVHADIEKSKSEPCPNTKSKSSNSSDGDTNTNLVIEKEKPKEKEKDKDSVVFPPVDPEPVGPVVLKSSSAKVRKSKSSKELLSGETHEEDEEDEDTTGKAKKKIVKKKKKNTSGEAKEGKTGKTKKSSNTTKSTKTKKSVFDKQNATSNEALAADEDEECEMDNDPNMPEYQAEDVPFSTKPNQSGKFNPPVQPRCNQNPMHHSNYVEGLVPTGTSVTPGSSSPRQTKNKAQASGTKASIGLEVDHKLSSNLVRRIFYIIFSLF